MQRSQDNVSEQSGAAIHLLSGAPFSALQRPLKPSPAAYKPMSHSPNPLSSSCALLWPSLWDEHSSRIAHMRHIQLTLARALAAAKQRHGGGGAVVPGAVHAQLAVDLPDFTRKELVWGGAYA